MVRLIKLWSAAFLLVFVVAGCGDEEITTSIVEGALDGTGTISVNVVEGGSLTRPVYLYSDGADIGAIEVMVSRRSDPTTAVWMVSSVAMASNDVSSPVEHSVVPLNAQKDVSVEADLQFNVWYNVKITRLDTSSNSRDFMIEQ